MVKSCVLRLIITQIGRKWYNLIKMYARITVFCVSVMQYPLTMCVAIGRINTYLRINAYLGINKYLGINTYHRISTIHKINTYLRTMDSKVIPAVWPYHASLRIVAEIVPRTAQIFITCRTRLAWIWRNMLLKKTWL